MNKLYEIRYYYDDQNYSKPTRKVFAPNESIAEKVAKRSKTYFVKLEIVELAPVENINVPEY